MRPKYALLLSLAIWAGCAAEPDPRAMDWRNITTVEDLWQENPAPVRALLGALDLERPALAPVARLLAAGDTIGAAQGLLAYFRALDRDWVVPTIESAPEEETMALAGQLRMDSVTIQDHTVSIPKTPADGWQWDYTGPDRDDEFGYGLNGLKYLAPLLPAWQRTEDESYVAVFDRVIRDWIFHHPLPAAGDSIYLVLDTTIRLDYRDIGEVEWRTLETGHRLGATWPQLFYAFQSAKAFTPAVRLLMLNSVQEQAGYLRRYHKAGHNWTTMEMNGLALAGLAFPEFKEAGDWADYALDVMSREINRQVYPDGTQTEISTKTQWVALHRFESVAENFQTAGRKISEAYLQRLEEMYNYLAYAMRPDGHQPLNNDSDREDLRPRVLKAAEKFDRPDWRFIATNGREGALPATGPTITFPWAGIHILRNSWDAKAHWAFFDTGPYGTGHQHRDKLHLSIAAFGKDLLVDGGRYTHQDYFSFDPTVWRGYFRSSFSHNVILVDGQGQNEGPTRASAPLIAGVDYRHDPRFDYAYGVFSDGYEGGEGKAVHHRSVLYVRDQFWIVLDRLETDRPRELQALWHYSPDCRVVLEGREAFSSDLDAPNLRIVPLGNVDWRVEIVSGQEKPVIQGWYSEQYGEKEPNPTLVYSASVSRSATFAWLLAAAAGPVPAFETSFQERTGEVAMTVSRAGLETVNITLPLTKDPARVKVNF